MIKQLTLNRFKRFRYEPVDVSDSIVLAGPNNSGKSTLLQAIAVWNLALQKWLFERGPGTKSKASKRTGVAITRKDFTAIPLREMNLLWTDRSTALSQSELPPGKKLGTARIMEVRLEGDDAEGEWALGFEFHYGGSEIVHVRPSDSTPIAPIADRLARLQIVHVPPFSGIGSDETRFDRAYQNLLIGQGKPGDILRNLLLELHEQENGAWSRLCNDIRTIFGYELLPPSYQNQPYIVCEYRPGIQDKVSRFPALDISTAGSGFLQVLMLLGFFYARPASILLLDEPDAHLHVVLQRQVYDRLRDIARTRRCQLLIATHSEVLVDATAPERIVSVLKKPHRLVQEAERDQVREALKRLTSLDVLLAEQAAGVLYVEGDTDLDLLREWARVLKHGATRFLVGHPFARSNQGRHPREARAHFFALKAVKPDIRGILLLDGDNRGLPDSEVTAEGLTVLRWRRYEAESYLVHQDVLVRFATPKQPDLFSNASPEKGLDFLREELPPAVLRDPLGEHDYLNATPASKTLLPVFFQKAGISITKSEYYQIAAQMRPDEIPAEVSEKLDLIERVLAPPSVVPEAE